MSALMTFAHVDTTQTPNVVTQTFTASFDYTDPSMATVGVTFVNVTDLSPQPAVGWTWDGTTFTEPTVDTNRSTLLSKAQAAIQSNETYLAIASPTSAQAEVQVAALTRQVNALLRLVANELSSTSGT